MTKKQQQIIGGGVALCLVLFLGGYFLLVSPKKSQIATTNASTASEQSTNATLRSQIAMLQQQQSGLVGKQVILQQVAQRIPSNADIPSLLRQLYQIHTTAGVDITSITPGVATAAVATAAVATTPTVATSSATTGAAAASTAVHPGASSSVASYQTIPISLNVIGDYSHMVIFLNKLETLQRLYLVKGLTLTPGAGAKGASSSTTTAVNPNGSPQIGDQLTATVTGEVYETSPDTTSIDLPALNGAATTGAAAAAVPTATPTASVN